ncbi:MAG: hypothetical protein JST68_22010 [Bacteroidetes bacterium]|nr:hypothetical protein [Bacteroidota bacterium]
MKPLLLRRAMLLASLFATTLSTKAQYLWNNDTAYKAGASGSGRLWGVLFGDYYVKAHSDSLNRGGNNQYSGIPKNRNAFAFRRIYLGYDYNISSKFSAEILLAAEDNFPAFNPPNSGTASGDELVNNKETFYIKYADIRWKNIWKGTDLIVGEQPTPSFPLISERIWSYRSIERTIADIRRTNSYDLGVGLQGKFDPLKGNFGYDLLVANGTSDKPASNSFKWFYGDVYAYFMDKKIVVDLYADYQRLNWEPGWHHDRQMMKAYVAYNTPGLTVGVEGFINTIRDDVKATQHDGGADTINTAAQGISLYIHGDIIPNKLRYFLRYDGYNPNHKIDNGKYSGYAGLGSPNGYETPGYHITYNPSNGTPTAATATTDITAKERFITAGLDFTPMKGVHFMPNVWYNHYSSQLAGGAMGDYDLVYRMTFSISFGR